MWVGGVVGGQKLQGAIFLTRCYLSRHARFLEFEPLNDVLPHYTEAAHAARENYYEAEHDGHEHGRLRPPHNSNELGRFEHFV